MNKDCNCWQWHAVDCKYFDFKQGYWNLKADIESLQTLINDDFEIKIFKKNNEFVIHAIHPTQKEEFTGDDLVDLVRDVDQWVTQCQAMM